MMSYAGAVAGWVAMLLSTASVAHAADRGQGYRGDGTGQYAVSGAVWTGQGEPRWKTQTPSWSNAGVTLAGKVVCTTAEPTTLFCVRRDTGEMLWSATNDYADTLAPEPRAAHVDMLAHLESWQAAHREALKRFSLLRREVRAHPERVDALMAVQAEVSELRAKLDQLAPYLTPDDKEIIGYASATPVFDGTHLYAQYGQGVVSSFALDGSRRWSVWLGPAPGAMRGYHMGASASPVLIDGVLVVGHGALRGLDPNTGAQLWVAEPYLDYGTPAPITVGGVGYVALPDGSLVRAKDGQIVARDLGDMNFVGPLAQGDMLFYVGGPSAEFLIPRGYMEAKAWRLVPGAEGVQAKALWRIEMPVFETLYSGALFANDAVYFADRSAMVRRIDVATGTLSDVRDLKEATEVGPLYASLSWASGRIYVIGEQGGIAVFSDDDPAGPIVHQMVGRSRAALTFDDAGWAYARTLSHIVAFGSR